ncbi:hypothetical protein [Deinococcus multiflagellatus]|uniref:Transposase n=1 Tax=Deinococcus multiflagellatus TaxID=1656887 RepID=A0ABW1ZFB3_9DEIO|nr:hypothetical protein [Deinococcus multiflagellatus]MBZ9711986.1 hypothetical protein [Deinococcus multiflagellatus]
MRPWTTLLYLLLGQPQPGLDPAARRAHARKRARLRRAGPVSAWALVRTALRELLLALWGQPSPASAARRRPRS